MTIPCGVRHALNPSSSSIYEHASTTIPHLSAFESHQTGSCSLLDPSGRNPSSFILLRLERGFVDQVLDEERIVEEDQNVCIFADAAI